MVIIFLLFWVFRSSLSDRIDLLPIGRSSVKTDGALKEYEKVYYSQNEAVWWVQGWLPTGPKLSWDVKEEYLA